MNINEHLLVCLAEECAEIQQAVSKALRFGVDDGRPGGETTNAQDICAEINDLLAVIQLLDDRGIINNIYNFDHVNAKKEKVAKFMGYARSTGALI